MLNKPDLDEIIEVGQLVHREQAPVHARDQPEVQRLLGSQRGARGRAGMLPVGHTRVHPQDLRRVDLPDDVGELGARREPLGVPLLAGPPRDRGVVAVLRQEPLARLVIGRSGPRARGSPGCRGTGSPRRGSSTSIRMRRLFACPFSPMKSMSCPARTALTISGITVSS
jgi:hypothetical protein